MEDRDKTKEQLHWQSIRVIGQTEIGRATVEALAMNRPLALAIRKEEILLGRHPPTS